MAFKNAVSSTPSFVTAPTLRGSSTRGSPYSRTASITVSQHTPSSWAICVTGRALRPTCLHASHPARRVRTHRDENAGRSPSRSARRRAAPGSGSGACTTPAEWGGRTPADREARPASGRALLPPPHSLATDRTTDRLDADDHLTRRLVHGKNSETIQAQHRLGKTGSVTHRQGSFLIVAALEQPQ